jgi:hypothetical protein
MGLIAAGACFSTAIRMFTRMPSAIAVYRSGLGWVEGGIERRIPWAQMARVERNVQVYMVAGRARRTDTVELVFAGGKSVLIWAEALTDYPVFADSVKHLHACGQLESGAGPRSQRSVVTRRCWHCGHAVEVIVSEIPVNVNCPGCGGGLGML